MNNLTLIKSDKFGETECDIYSDSKEMYMTAGQLGECLEYAEPIIAINKVVSRNPYLKNAEFSVVTKLLNSIVIVTGSARHYHIELGKIPQTPFRFPHRDLR